VADALAAALFSAISGWVYFTARWDILSAQAFLPIVRFSFSQNIASNATYGVQTRNLAITLLTLTDP